MPPADLSLAVVGARFPNKKGPPRRFEIKVSVPGEPVELRLEPTNKADANAVAVFSSRGIQIGYVIADRARMIGDAIRAGCDVRAIFQKETVYGAVIRVTMDGNDPDLPPDFGGDGPPPDFYPDEVWPDD